MKFVNRKESVKFSFFSFFSFFRKKAPDVWLIGENLGKSNHDNGFYFFKYVIENTEKKVFFLVDKRKGVPEELREYSGNVLFLNSWRHYFYYFKARYCIVSHGIRDAVPQYIVARKRRHIKPIIYLQHGVIKYKKLPYNKLSYNKSIIRFLASSQDEKLIISQRMMPAKMEHDFKFLKWKLASNDFLKRELSKEGCDYDDSLFSISEYVTQKGYGENLAKSFKRLKSKVGIEASRVPVTGLPRYDSLIEEAEKSERSGSILIFPTWREYLVKKDIKEFFESDFYKHYYELLTSDEFLCFLEVNDLEVNFLLHVEMMRFAECFEVFQSARVNVLSAGSDLREKILESAMLITDYSSVAWEFSLLDKKTVFYHFDFEEYLLRRGTYATKEDDWNGEIAHTKEEVVDCLKRAIFPQSSEVVSLQEKYGFVTAAGSCSRVVDEIDSIPPKIHFIVYNIYGVGGTVKTVINIANYLYSRGYDVEIISVRRTHEEPRLGLDPGVKVRPLYDARRKAYVKKANKKAWLKSLFVRVLRKFPSLLIHRKEELYAMFTLYTDLQIIRHLLSIKDGVLVSTIPSFNSLSARFVSNNVFKIGQEHRTYYDHDKSLVRDLFGRYDKLDVLTVLTKDDASSFKEKLPSVNAVVQENGTYVDPSIPSVDYSAKKIVSLGRLIDYKGYDLLVEAFSKISQSYPEWVLEIYGKGEEKEKLDYQIESLGLRHQVFIYDPVDDIESVLKSASIFALPSKVEPFGMVVIEAGSCGLPIVCFDIPYGPRSLVKSNKNGLLAEAFNVYDFSKKMSALMSDSELREKMGRSSHELVLKNYSIEATGERFERLLPSS